MNMHRLPTLTIYVHMYFVLTLTSSHVVTLQTPPAEPADPYHPLLPSCHPLSPLLLLLLLPPSCSVLLFCRRTRRRCLTPLHTRHLNQLHACAWRGQQQHGHLLLLLLLLQPDMTNGEGVGGGGEEKVGVGGVLGYVYGCGCEQMTCVP